MGILGDAGEMPTQLNRGGELPALIEGGADRHSLLLSDDEHRRSMGVLVAPDKSRLAWLALRT